MSESTLRRLRFFLFPFVPPGAKILLERRRRRDASTVYSSNHFLSSHILSPFLLPGIAHLSPPFAALHLPSVPLSW